MAIIRFLDKNKTCYQINSPENTIMICLNKNERERLLQAKDHECLIFINNKLDENEIEARRNAINTKEIEKIKILL